MRKKKVDVYFEDEHIAFKVEIPSYEEQEYAVNEVYERIHKNQRQKIKYITVDMDQYPQKATRHF